LLDVRETAPETGERVTPQGKFPKAFHSIPDAPKKEHMAIYKRGKVYWYKFVWQGKVIRESTKQGNHKIARDMEAAHRTSLAKGEVGIREKKQAPTLSEFAEKDALLSCTRKG